MLTEPLGDPVQPITIIKRTLVLCPVENSVRRCETDTDPFRRQANKNQDRLLLMGKKEFVEKNLALLLFFCFLCSLPYFHLLSPADSSPVASKPSVFTIGYNKDIVYTNPTIK